MKRLLLFSSLFIAAVASFSQVRWLEETHNFGAFDENGGAVSCAMKFVNESDKPVIINQVHVTCGCTSPKFDKKSIAPGDTGSVIITYNPTGRPGRFEKRIYVDINTEPSRYTLYIKGSVIGSPSTVNEKYPVKAGPLRLRSASAPFGEVLMGKSKSYFLEVYNASTDTLQPQWIGLPGFLAVGGTDKTLYPGENMAYTFMLSSDKVNDYGLTIDSLVLVPDKRYPDSTFIIPMMVMVNEDFSHLTPGQRLKAPAISPATTLVNLGEVSENSGRTSTTVEIKNTGDSPLIIRRVYSADPGVSVGITSTKIKKGQNAELRISINVDEIQGKVINARAVIISNDPAEPVLTLRISGVIGS